MLTYLSVKAVLLVAKYVSLIQWQIFKLKYIHEIDLRQICLILLSCTCRFGFPLDITESSNDSRVVLSPKFTVFRLTQTANSSSHIERPQHTVNDVFYLSQLIFSHETVTLLWSWKFKRNWICNTEEIYITGRPCPGRLLKHNLSIIFITCSSVIEYKWCL